MEGSKYRTDREAVDAEDEKCDSAPEYFRDPSHRGETPCCSRCQDLEKCRVLNGNVVEDKYYPNEMLILGSCNNFEDQAHNLDIFGAEKTFRNTPQCREMVYDYICAFWASQNSQYDNRCAAR